MKCLVFCFILLIGCLPSKEKRAVRKLEKAMKLDPNLFSNDTIKVFDTVVIEKFAFDTVHSFVEHDTVVVINNEKAVLKYFYDTTRFEIYHEFECKSDTIYREVEVIVEKPPPLILKGFKNWLIVVLIGLFVLVSIVKRRS